MLDVKKTPRRVVKMASLGCVVTLALVATLLITGHAAPQRRAPRGASGQAHADDSILAEALRVDPDSSSKRAPSPNSGSSSGFLAKPQKGVSEVPKKYTPKDTSKTPVKSTPIPPPNPQVYLLPTENVKLVFPDDDETVMAANLRALDDQLGRPSDLHAIILESGEDADTFSRALHDFQERTYNSKKVTETHDPTYQQDLLQGQFQYQAMLAHQSKPSKRHNAKNHVQARPPPLVYQQQPLVQADPFLLQQHPRQTVYRQSIDTYRGHRRRRSVLVSEGEDDVPVPISRDKSLSGNSIYPPFLRHIRSPDDESSEMRSDERRKFGSDESDERPRLKPNAKPSKLIMSPKVTTSSSTQDKASLKVKSKNDTKAGPEKASPFTDVGLGTEPPGAASDQNLLDQLALDVSSSAEADDLLDYPVEINGMLVSSELSSAEDDAITGTASPAVLMEMDRDSDEISSEAPASKESLESFESSESSGSIEKSSERPDSSEQSLESSSSVEKSSESPESSEKNSESSSSVEKSSDSSEMSSEQSSSVERNSGSAESDDSSGVSSETDDNAEKSSQSQESSESIDSAEMSSEAPDSSEFSIEDTDSSESSSESSNNSQNSFEDSASSEASSEYPDSSESPDSIEFFNSFELQDSTPTSSVQGTMNAELFDSTEKIPGILHSFELSSELSSELFRSFENSREILINFQVTPEVIDESRKIVEVLNDLKNTKTTSLTTEKDPEVTKTIALNSGFLDKDGKNEINSVTVAPTENSTDYYTTTLDSAELPFSVELFDPYDGSTDEPVVYSDKTEFFDSSENYVDSMETWQSSGFDEPKVLDDAVKNSMNGKKDFNMTKQYPSGASSVSSGSDGPFKVEDLTAESGKDQDKEMTENEDSNFRKNFAKSLDAKGFSKLPGKKSVRKSSTTQVGAHEKRRGKSLDSSFHEASGPGTQEFGHEFLSNVHDNLSLEGTGVG